MRGSDSACNGDAVEIRSGWRLRLFTQMVRGKPLMVQCISSRPDGLDGKWSGLYVIWSRAYT